MVFYMVSCAKVSIGTLTPLAQCTKIQTQETDFHMEIYALQWNNRLYTRIIYSSGWVKEPLTSS